MKHGIITFLRFAVIVMGAAVMALCAFWVPDLANWAAKTYPEFVSLRIPVVIGVFITTIPFFLALYQTMKLLGYIHNKNAFSSMAVASLRHIKHYAMCEALLYLLGLAALWTRNALHLGVAVMGGAIIFAALTISLFAALLQELLANALEIKSENDLTI